MSTTTTWPGGAVDATPTAYAVPASGELNWSSLSAFLNVLATSAQSTTAQKWGVRKATATPVTVSATADCVVVCQLTVAGAVAVNLPAGANKQVFVVVDGTGDASTNNITINRNGADTIAGATSLVLSVDRETVVLVYNASDTDWKIAARSRTVTPLASGVSGVLPIANGGTAKALTLAAGGLVWTDADSMEVSAAGTASMWALSGGAGAPTFSNTTTTAKIFTLGLKLKDTGNGSDTLTFYKTDAATTYTFAFDGGGTNSGARTVYVVRIGALVTILVSCNTATATGTSTAMTATAALPTWAFPATTATAVINGKNAGSFEYSTFQVDGSGVMQFLRLGGVLYTAGVGGPYGNATISYYTAAAG